jgi:hypothetical protein
MTHDFGFTPEPIRPDPDESRNAWLFAALPEVERLVTAGLTVDITKLRASLVDAPADPEMSLLLVALRRTPRVLRFDGFPTLVVLAATSPRLEGRRQHPVSLREAADHLDDLAATLIATWDMVLIEQAPQPCVLLGYLTYDLLGNLPSDAQLQQAAALVERRRPALPPGRVPRTIPGEMVLATSGLAGEPDANLNAGDLRWLVQTLQRERGWTAADLVEAFHATPDEVRKRLGAAQGENADPAPLRETLTAVFGDDLERAARDLLIGRRETRHRSESITDGLARAGIGERQFSELMWDGEVEQVTALAPAMGRELLAELADLYGRRDVASALQSPGKPARPAP